MAAIGYEWRWQTCIKSSQLTERARVEYELYISKGGSTIGMVPKWVFKGQHIRWYAKLSLVLHTANISTNLHPLEYQKSFINLASFALEECLTTDIVAQGEYYTQAVSMFSIIPQ